MASYAGLQEPVGISTPSRPPRTNQPEGRLPTERLNLLREKGLTTTELGATVVPLRTLKRRQARGESLSLEETVRAERVANLLDFAAEVFGNREKSLRWLRGKDDRLDDRTALSLLKTEAGCDVVRSMLWQIAEGVFT
jgi:putative toxin-antitoxin system antitoxin component (TIGR02293 family)